MDEYSTVEHAVGTWIDGKTVYEITFFKDSGFAYNTLMNLGAIPSGFDSVISANGYIRRANNNFDVFNWSNPQGNSEKLQLKVYDGQFGVHVGSAFNPILELAVTFRYTKTSN